MRQKGESTRFKTGNAKRNSRCDNPLSRTYESNGPNAKVRGTAHHMVEKYRELANGARLAGDNIMAESRLQHAEHYLRLIANYQEQKNQSSAKGVATLEAGEPVNGANPDDGESSFGEIANSRTRRPNGGDGGRGDGGQGDGGQGDGGQGVRKRKSRLGGGGVRDKGTGIIGGNMWLRSHKRNRKVPTSPENRRNPSQKLEAPDNPNS